MLHGLGHAPGVEPPPIIKSETGRPKPRRKGRVKFIVLAVLIVVALAAAMYAALQHKEPAIKVQTEKVSRRNITETVVANGKIYPVLQVHISPEVSGEIIELPVKEGQFVHKGDLLLKINPDVYIASLNQANAGYESSIAAKDTAIANLEKAETDFKRNEELFKRKLLSESDFIGFKVARDVAKANLESAEDQVNVSKATVDNAQDELNKTTIVSPLDGTITTLNSQLGERVLGTAQNEGTDIMTLSDLSQMEAWVDVGEMDIVHLAPGEKASLEVDSFKDRKFSGVVTAVASSSEGLDTGSAVSTLSSSSSSSSGQSAIQFQVRIRITDKEDFRPGMSVSAEIATRSSTNVLAVPIASITTRILKDKAKGGSATTNAVTNSSKLDKKSADADKNTDVVFVVQGDHVKAVPVKYDLSDDNYYEITNGLKEGDEIVVGGYQAINHDLEDGKRIVRGSADTTAPTADK